MTHFVTYALSLIFAELHCHAECRVRRHPQTLTDRSHRGQIRITRQAQGGGDGRRRKIQDRVVELIGTQTNFYAKNRMVATLISTETVTIGDVDYSSARISIELSIEKKVDAIVGQEAPPLVTSPT